MKLLATVSLALACFAQTTPEPEVADIFFRLDQNKLVPLERQSAAIRGGAHGFIVMSIKSASEFPGAKSPVRFKRGEPLEFVVRSAIRVSLVDPNTIYCLRKLNGKKKTRELLITSGHASPIGASTTTTPAEYQRSSKIFIPPNFGPGPRPRARHGPRCKPEPTPRT